MLRTTLSPGQGLRANGVKPNGVCVCAHACVCVRVCVGKRAALFPPGDRHIALAEAVA